MVKEERRGLRSWLARITRPTGRQIASPMMAAMMETPMTDPHAMEAPAMEAPAMDPPAMEAPAMDPPAMEAPAMDPPAMEPAMADTRMGEAASMEPTG